MDTLVGTRRTREPNSLEIAEVSRIYHAGLVECALEFGLNGATISLFLRAEELGTVVANDDS